MGEIGKALFLKKRDGAFCFFPLSLPLPLLKAGRGLGEGARKGTSSKKGDGYVTFCSQIEHGHYLCNVRLDIEIATV